MVFNPGALSMARRPAGSIGSIGISPGEKLWHVRLPMARLFCSCEVRTAHRSSRKTKFDSTVTHMKWVRVELIG